MAMATRLLDKILLNRVSKILEEIKIPSFEHNIAYKKKLSPQDILALVLDTLDLI